jgi:hydroxymethylbilane synthase
VSAQVIRIATRASQLALWQANHVADLLRRTNPGVSVELVHVTTSGDRDRTGKLAQLGTVGVFTREVQTAVLDGRADIAVHSLKDLPTIVTEGLVLAAVPERASPFDALVLPRREGSAPHADLQSLPRGARVGTGSLRRQAQLLHERSDLQMLDIRGNVETRIAKLDAGEYDAIVLAEAGLTRLNLGDRISIGLRPPAMYPAVGQGALGIECRGDDAQVLAALEKINAPSVLRAVRAERKLLSALEAGCHAPVGVLSEVAGERLSLDAVVLSRDGRERIIARDSGSADDPEAVGLKVAEKLLAQGAAPFIEQAEQQ